VVEGNGGKWHGGLQGEEEGQEEKQRAVEEKEEKDISYEYRGSW